MFLNKSSDVSKTFLTLTTYLTDVIFTNDVQVRIALESVFGMARQNKLKNNFCQAILKDRTVSLALPFRKNKLNVPSLTVAISECCPKVRDSF